MIDDEEIKLPLASDLRCIERDINIIENRRKGMFIIKKTLEGYAKVGRSSCPFFRREIERYNLDIVNIITMLYDLGYSVSKNMDGYGNIDSINVSW